MPQGVLKEVSANLYELQESAPVEESIQSGLAFKLDIFYHANMTAKMLIYIMLYQILSRISRIS